MEFIYIYIYIYIYIHITCTVHDPEIVKSLPRSPVKLKTCKMTPPTLCFFNFNMFANNLDLDLLLTNPDSIPCRCTISAFVDRHHNHTMVGDLRIIKSNDLRKRFTKGPKYKEIRSTNFQRAKCCIL